MSHRQDLLELTPEALTALANAGFVKRAQKDVAAGLLPQLDMQADGTVVAQFDDGVTTRLPPGRTLRDATCTCPASSMCRHRVMLVLAYQARMLAQGATPSSAAPADSDSKTVGDAAALAAVPEAISDAPAVPQPEAAAGFWSPAQFDDAALAASLAPSVLDQAARLAVSHPVVGVQAWRSASVPPVARLPMCNVRFFSRSSLAHARCDCKQGSGCAHVVLAVWAFRLAGALAPGAAEVMVELTPRSPDGAAVAAPSSPLQTEAAQAARTQIDALLLALWLDGSSQPLMALAARFEAVRAQVQALGWRWVDDALAELWQLLQDQQARSTRFDARRLLAVVAELWARLHAAGHVQAQAEQGARPVRLASQILGTGVKGEVALDHLRLVSLGAALWSDEQAEGASVLLADPDTQALTVLERRWPRAADAAAGGTPAALAGRRVAGFPLRQLASGQVITKTATRRANGVIDISAGARQTGVLPLSPTSWDELAAPLKLASVPALVAQLRNALPDFVQPRQAATGATTGASGALHVLALDALEAVNLHWDAAAQVLHADLLRAEADEEGSAAAPQPHEPLHLELPHRAAAPGAVDALARALSGEWGALRAVAGTVRLQSGVAVMQPLALLTAQRAVVLQVEAPAPQSLPLESATEEPLPLAHLAADTLALLAQWLRQGLRRQGGGLSARASAQTARLRQAGLGRCAALLQAAHDGLRYANRAALVGQLATLSLLVEGVERA